MLSAGDGGACRRCEHRLDGHIIFCADRSVGVVGGAARRVPWFLFREC